MYLYNLFMYIFYLNNLIHIHMYIFTIINFKDNQNVMINMKICML